MAFARLRAASTRAPIATGELIALLALVIAAPPALAEGSDRFGVTQPQSIPEVATGRPTIDGRISDRHSLDGDGVRARGVIEHVGAGRATVRLQVRKAGTRRWRTVVTRKVPGSRKFTLVWHGRRPGRFIVRLVGRAGDARAFDRLGTVYVYRPSFASWYGPGFYGRRTACGGRLTASVLGVAHKTLPCGTRVTFHLHGRTVTAKVIDRGPFAAGRDWDLTPALKRRLRFGSTGRVHATS